MSGSLARRGLATSLEQARRGLVTPLVLATSQEQARRGLATSPTSPAWRAFSKEKEKTSAHSALVGKDKYVYEMVTDHVVPAQWEQYLANKRLQVQYTNDDPTIRLVHSRNTLASRALNLHLKVILWVGASLFLPYSLSFVSKLYV